MTFTQHGHLWFCLMTSPYLPVWILWIGFERWHAFCTPPNTLVWNWRHRVVTGEHCRHTECHFWLTPFFIYPWSFSVWKLFNIWINMWYNNYWLIKMIFTLFYEMGKQTFKGATLQCTIFYMLLFKYMWMQYITCI